MNVLQMILMVVAMAVVTYLIRMIPLSFFRKKIKSKFLLSFFYYIPYAVLAAMTFPAIFFSINNVWSWAALAGTVVAFIAAITRRSLLIVAVSACVACMIILLVA